VYQRHIDVKVGVFGGWNDVYGIGWKMSGKWWLKLATDQANNKNNVLLVAPCCCCMMNDCGWATQMDKWTANNGQTC